MNVLVIFGGCCIYCVLIYFVYFEGYINLVFDKKIEMVYVLFDCCLCFFFYYFNGVKVVKMVLY